MVIGNQYKLREVAGEHVILKQGKAGTELTRIISLNESAKMLYERFFGRSFNLDMVAQALVEEYGIDEVSAKNDAEVWINQLKEQGVVTE